MQFKKIPGHVFALIAKLPHEDAVHVRVDDWRLESLKNERDARVAEAEATNVIAHRDGALLLARTLVRLVEAERIQKHAQRNVVLDLI